MRQDVPRTWSDAVIKAYDVRGVVGEQIDDEFVRDVGAAFARLDTRPTRRAW